MYRRKEVERLVWIFLYVCGGLHYGNILKTLASLWSGVLLSYCVGSLREEMHCRVTLDHGLRIAPGRKPLKHEFDSTSI